MQKGGDARGETTQPSRLEEGPGAVVGGRPLPPLTAPALHPAHHHRPRHPRRLRGQETFNRTSLQGSYVASRPCTQGCPGSNPKRGYVFSDHFTSLKSP